MGRCGAGHRRRCGTAPGEPPGPGGRGFVIYLYATVDEQVRRTRRDRRRPLLQNGDPEQVLRDLMAERDPLYREIADHIIETDACSPRTVAQRLVRELQEP